MYQNGIYHLGVSALASAFACNPNMVRLNLEDNTLTAQGADAIAKVKHVPGFGLFLKNVFFVLEILPKIPKLEVLNLNDCLLRSQGALILARALKRNCPNLRVGYWIYLTVQCMFQYEYERIVCQEVLLCGNEINGMAAFEIGKALVTKKHLDLLDLGGMCMFQEAFKSILFII